MQALNHHSRPTTVNYTIQWTRCGGQLLPNVQPDETWNPKRRHGEHISTDCL